MLIPYQNIEYSITRVLEYCTPLDYLLQAVFKEIE